MAARSLIVVLISALLASFLVSEAGGASTRATDSAGNGAVLSLADTD